MPTRRTTWLTLATATALAIVATTESASAFCRSTTSREQDRGFCPTTGLPVYWKSACVGYTIQENAFPGIELGAFTRAVDTAFNVWNDVKCTGGPVGIRATSLGTVQCSEARYNIGGPNQNVILLRTGLGDNILALTTLTFDNATGEIYDADMEINAGEQKFVFEPGPFPPGTVSLDATLRHEIGHFFGLAHTTIPLALMLPGYPDPFQTVGKDETAGICTVYPDATHRVAAGDKTVPASACDPSPRGGLSTACVAPEPGCTIASTAGGAPTSPRTPAIALVTVVCALARRRRTRTNSASDPARPSCT